jgi:signal transduction histidine kinase
VPVPLLATACRVYMCDAQGVPQVAAEHDGGSGFAALAGVEPRQLLELTGATPLEAPGHHVLLVLLAARGKPLGAIALARQHDDGAFTPARIALAEELAARAALFVDNAKLYLEAQRAIAARDDFLAIASHDLKSPLGAVLFSASVLKRVAEPGPVWEHVRHTADSILHAATSMERLVHDLVDLAALDAGLLSTNKQQHVAGEIVSDAVKLYDPLAAERSVSLRPEGVELTTPVLADRGRVLQVLGNLIANAVTYAPPDSVVDVAARDGGQDGVVFSVRDNGPGIDGDLLPRIFDRYTRGRARGGRSVGLGLSIASKLVEAHGGRIWVESLPGQGTCFHFTVPRA